ncbi:HlyD family secretion protein [Polaromonas sp. OV174]|uniref:efflux RND transporter periplasmic adaptor subunit n=1 Tax=Polaromonas sp. OV174 TaxID=1855300 RepID=UPI0008EFA60B|nr:efflux RND transporter periplasmic adaptor subunit [Polaromonas sp. OV174]SFB91100.1 HlyD family secretion protein [Polaromonas sp. OV174]
MPALAPLMKRRWLWGGAGLVLALLVLWAWSAWRAPQVDAVVLQSMPLVRTLQFSARVATLSRVSVGSTVTGRVASVVVDEGAQVRQGEVLVQLETAELQAALGQAQGAERQAAARVVGLRSTGRTAASAQVAQAQASVRAADADLKRTQQLVAQGFLSDARLDEVRRSVDVAQAQLLGAKAQARANEDQGSDVVQAQAQLAQARAASQSAQVRLEQATVRAPTAARVLSRSVEPGQIVQPGAALMSLALAGPTQLVAQVDERFLDQLRVGQAAAVVADAFAGQPFAAQVLSIAPAVDAQRGAIEVKLSLAGAAPAFLREDMTLSVEVETGRRDKTLVLPLAALQETAAGATASVLVADHGRARKQAVSLGLRTLGAVEVLEGLHEGDTVLLGNELRAGARVRPREVAFRASSGISGAAREDAAATMTNAIGR